MAKDSLTFRAKLDYLPKQLDPIVSYIKHLEERIQRLESQAFKKKKPAKTEGSEVWEAYSSVYKVRYGITPPRSAKTNSICKQLVDRLGKSEAIEIVKFFVYQNDAFYVKKMHPIQLCLNDAESLYTRRQTGKKISEKEARQLENTSDSVNSSQQYLRRKYGDG